MERLFAALVSEIRFQAAQLGSFQQRGRLDPPLLMALDEATDCPVPVPAWPADAGGKGVSLTVVSHNEAQMRTSWGPDGAQVVMDTCGTVKCLAGIKDTDTLETPSKLCDENGTSSAARSTTHSTRS